MITDLLDGQFEENEHVYKERNGCKEKTWL